MVDRPIITTHPRMPSTLAPFCTTAPKPVVLIEEGREMPALRSLELAVAEHASC